MLIVGSPEINDHLYGVSLDFYAPDGVLLAPLVSDFNSDSDLAGSFTFPQANPISLPVGHSAGYGLAIMTLSWCDSGDTTLDITPPAGYTIALQVQNSTSAGLGGIVAYKLVNAPGDHGGAFTVGETGTTSRAWLQNGCVLHAQTLSKNGFSKR
jgi:hypothetical protein